MLSDVPFPLPRYFSKIQFQRTAGELVGANGNPISLETQEENDKETTLEASLTEIKLNIFKSNQISIIERLQQRLLNDLEKNTEPGDLLSLSECIRSSIATLEQAEDIYPEAD